MGGLMLRTTRTRSGIKQWEETQQIITEEWTQWHADSIDQYKIYVEIKEEENKGAFASRILPYQEWLPYYMRENKQPVKHRYEVRGRSKEIRGSDGFDVVLLDLPEEAGSISMFGYDIDLVPFKGKFYLSDALMIAGLIGIAGSGVQSLKNMANPLS